jgi:hypothetical protein
VTHLEPAKPINGSDLDRCLGAQLVARESADRSRRAMAASEGVQPSPAPSSSSTRASISFDLPVGQMLDVDGVLPRISMAPETRRAWLRGQGVACCVF